MNATYFDPRHDNPAQSHWIDPAAVASVAPLRVRLEQRLEAVRAQIEDGNAKFEATPIYLKAADSRYTGPCTPNPVSDALDLQIRHMETEETALIAAVRACQEAEIKGLEAPMVEIPDWRKALAKERLEQAKEAQEQAIAEAKEAADSPFEPDEPVKPRDPTYAPAQAKRGEVLCAIQGRENSSGTWGAAFAWEIVAGKLVGFPEFPKRQFIVFRRQLFLRQHHRNPKFTSWSIVDVLTGRIFTQYHDTQKAALAEAAELIALHGKAKTVKSFREAEKKLRDLPPKPAISNQQ